MSDDYLWDRSGEPDPEIVRLEQTLSRLRHQPKAAALPQIATEAHRTFFPALAAAAVILMVLASGLWLALRRPINEERSSPRLVIASPVANLLAQVNSPASPGVPNIKGADSDQPPLSPSQAARKMAGRRMNAETQLVPAVARRVERRRNDAEVMREGEEATEKVMMALRYASSKLNLVQKKIQVNKESGPAS